MPDMAPQTPVSQNDDFLLLNIHLALPAVRAHQQGERGVKVDGGLWNFGVTLTEHISYPSFLVSDCMSTLLNYLNFPHNS